MQRRHKTQDGTARKIKSGNHFHLLQLLIAIFLLFNNLIFNLGIIVIKSTQEQPALTAEVRFNINATTCARIISHTVQPKENKILTLQ